MGIEVEGGEFIVDRGQPKYEWVNRKQPTYKEGGLVSVFSQCVLHSEPVEACKDIGNIHPLREFNTRLNFVCEYWSSRLINLFKL
jgi:hypothetical protein